MAGLTLGTDYFCGRRQHCRRAGSFRRRWPLDGRRAEFDLRRLFRAVYRPRDRFRHPIQRAIPCRAIRAGDVARRPAQRRTKSRPTFGAGGSRHRRRVFFVCADRLSRPLRARRDRRRRNGHRFFDQHHLAAGAVDPVETARRAPPNGVCGLGARGSLFGALPAPGSRRNWRRGHRRLAAAAVVALRLQSASSSECQGAGGGDLSRIAPKPADRRQRDRDHDAGPRCRKCALAAARVIAASRADHDPRHPDTRRSGAKAPTDPKGRRGAVAIAPPGAGRTATDRRTDRPGAVLDSRRSCPDRRKFAMDPGPRRQGACPGCSTSWRKPTPPHAGGPRPPLSSRCASLSTTCGKR